MLCTIDDRESHKITQHGVHVEGSAESIRTVGTQCLLSIPYKPDVITLNLQVRKLCEVRQTIRKVTSEAIVRRFPVEMGIKQTQ